jgi:hypothetical protein
MTGIAQAQYDALELARRELFVANGQSGDLTLLRYVNGALTEGKVISAAWSYSDRDASNNRLPPDVLYELQIHESLLDAVVDVPGITAVRHSGVIYQIIRPTPLPPTGLLRFWRFWLSPQESE